MIKQMIQVPENLTPVILVTQEDGTDAWEDAARSGTPVFIALTDEDEVLPYTIDGTGVGGLGGTIAYRPTVHCPKCLQRMWVKTHKDLTEPLEYECPCGVVRRIETE